MAVTIGNTIPEDAAKVPVVGNATPTETLPLRAIRIKDPARALGLAAGFMANDAIFSRQPFGHWSKTLIGQINRGHYLIALEGKKPVGFVGWALADEATADLWLSGNDTLMGQSARLGDSVIINCLIGKSERVTNFLTACMRKSFSDKEFVFGKRFYADGRIRKLKIGINSSAKS